MKSKPSISVFFPCFNDVGSITQLVEKAYKNLEKLASSYEVIVVDDGSKDGCQKVLLDLKAKKFPKLKLVFHRKNKGYGGALISGFKAAKKDLIFYTDGDAQYDVDEMSLLVQLMTKDVNFVNGIKMERGDRQGYRQIVGAAYNFAVRWMFWLPIFDTDCDFRLIRRSLIKKIKLRTHTGAICVCLVKKCQIHGARFRQISVHHYDRKHGSSQFFNFKNITRTLVELCRIWVELIIEKKYERKRV